MRRHGRGGDCRWVDGRGSGPLRRPPPPAPPPATSQDGASRGAETIGHHCRRRRGIVGGTARLEGSGRGGVGEEEDGGDKSRAASNGTKGLAAVLGVRGGEDGVGGRRLFSWWRRAAATRLRSRQQGAAGAVGHIAGSGGCCGLSSWGGLCRHNEPAGGRCSARRPPVRERLQWHPRPAAITRTAARACHRHKHLREVVKGATVCPERRGSARAHRENRVGRGGMVSDPLKKNV